MPARTSLQLLYVGSIVMALRTLILSVRSLWHSRSFSSGVIFALAAGVGATACVFALIDSIVLKPLPYSAPTTLAALAHVDESAGNRWATLSGVEFSELRSMKSVTGISIYDIEFESIRVLSPSASELRAATVSAEFLKLLGVRLHSGRDFGRDDETVGAVRPIILSYAAWERLFGQNTDAIGQVLRSDSGPLQIVGVLPRTFRYPLPIGWIDHPDALVAVQGLGVNDGQSLATRYRAIIRLRASVPPNAVGADVINRLRSVDTVLGTARTRTYSVLPLRDILVAPQNAVVRILVMAVATACFIIFANLCGLFCIRILNRANDVPIRIALGASYVQAHAPFIREALLLGLVGGLAASTIGANLISLLGVALPRQLILGAGPTFDARVLTFAMALSVCSTVLAAVVASLAVLTRRTGTSLHRATSVAMRGRLAEFGVVATCSAASVMLAIAAAILAKSGISMSRIDLGFDTNNLAATFVVLDRSKYQSPPSQEIAFTTLIENLRAVPGVIEIAQADFPPLNNAGALGRLQLESESVPAEIRRVSSSYFNVLRVPFLLGGTLPEKSDDARHSPMVVNELFVKQLGLGSSPIGKVLRTKDGRLLTIVGVVGGLREQSPLIEPKPSVYLPFDDQAYRRFGTRALLLQTRTRVEDFAAQCQEIVEAIGTSRAVRVQNMADIERAFSQSQRFYAIVFGLFAVVTLAITLLGIAGVVVQAVSLRRKETAVRYALGATRWWVESNLVRPVMTAATTGAILGATGWLWFHRVLEGVLYRTPSVDLSVMIWMVTVVLVACAASAWIPARSEASAEPAAVLREP